MRSKIISILCFVFCAIVIVVGVIVINNTKIPTHQDIDQSTDQSTSQDEAQGEDVTLSLSCQDVVMYIDDKFAQIKYSVNTNDNYTVDYNYDTSKLTIEKDKIYAHESGEYTVTMTLTTSSEKIATDNFTVTIYDTVTQASAKVQKDGENIDNLFCYENYDAVFTLNAAMHTDFTVYTSENVNKLNLVQSEDKQKVIFSFTTIDSNDIVFIFTYRNFTKTFTFSVYQYIDNFNVSFSNSFTDDVLALYNFNDTYISQANIDNIFDQASFEITTNPDTLQMFDVTTLNADIAKVVDNKIIAQKEGETSLVITAQDGSSFQKSIKISVRTIKVNNITTKDEQINLHVGESFEVLYSYSPIYAVCDFKIASPGLTLSEQTVTASSVGNFEVTIFDNISNQSAKIYVTVTTDEQPSEISYEITINSSFLDLYQATFENDILTINTDEQIQIPFSFVLVYSNGQSYDGEITTDVSVSTDNFSNINYGLEVDTNYCILTVKGNGTIKVTLTLLVNGESTDITRSLTIIIN